jgi:hypothetical protein
MKYLRQDEKVSIFVTSLVWIRERKLKGRKEIKIKEFDFK